MRRSIVLSLSMYSRNGRRTTSLWSNSSTVSRRPNVRFGSKADAGRCPLSARSGHSRGTHIRAFEHVSRLSAISMFGPSPATDYNAAPCSEERSVMAGGNDFEVDIGRRDALKTIGAAAVGASAGTSLFTTSTASAATGVSRAEATQRAGGPYNILFILTDQERYFRPGELPKDYRIPAHERLAKKGIVFENHHINSCVCTPSRSVVYTGRHIQQTKMFDNTNFPWISSMSTDLPTVGDMLREAGYYTAYKGKWHLTKEFETVNKLGTPTKIFTQEMEAYGFSDYFGIGGIIAAMGVSWLRGKGRDLAAEGKPWFLAVNLVNPHDVMFYDTDAPGTPVQKKRGLTQVERDPIDPLYAVQWDFALPQSHAQPLNARG